MLDAVLPRPSSGIHRNPNMTLLNGHDSGASGEESLQRVRNLPGYTTPIFNGKDEQRAKVKVDVTTKVLLSVSFEVDPHCALHH